MKWAIIFCVLIFSCAKEKVTPTKIGCESGEINGMRVTFRCCTFEEFLAGSHVDKGGTAMFTYYKRVQWARCNDCK